MSTTAFVSEERSERPILVVAIHGDAPFNKPDYQYVFAAKLAARHRDVVAVGLLRPGYTDPEGHTSDGERGEAVGDNFHVTNTDAIADVIGELKRRWNARNVVVAFGAEPPIERFDEGVVRRLPRPGEVQDHALLVGP